MKYNLQKKSKEEKSIKLVYTWIMQALIYDQLDLNVLKAKPLIRSLNKYVGEFSVIWSLE